MSYPYERLKAFSCGIVAIYSGDGLAGLAKEAAGISDDEQFIDNLLNTHRRESLEPLVSAITVSNKCEKSSQLHGPGSTPREREVVYWVAERKYDMEIAIILGSATTTVSKHVKNLPRKLGAETRMGAVQSASLQ